MSVEMQLPKILHLKQTLPQLYEQAGAFMDLADFLAFKACGQHHIRSVCTTTCKWTFAQGPVGRSAVQCHRSVDQESCCSSLNNAAGLADLLEHNKIGRVCAPIGSLQGKLTSAACSETGLAPDTCVAVGAIDAHAGAVALLGVASSLDTAASDLSFANRLALICGTSTCHMAIASEPHFIEGVWGPYANAVLDHHFLNEAGQSASGWFASPVRRTLDSTQARCWTM